MTRINWPLMGLFTALVSGLLVGTFEKIAPTCDADLLSKASDQMKNVVFSCAEFWLNRYQSFIGNVITAAVAGASLYWIARQLQITSQQSSATASATVRVIAEALEFERTWITSILDVTWKIIEIAEPWKGANWVTSNVIGQLQYTEALETDLFNLMDKLEYHKRRREHVDEDRFRGLEQSIVLAYAAVSRYRFGLLKSQGQGDRTIVEARLASDFTFMIEKTALAREHCFAWRAELDDACALAWKKAREFEKRAIAG